MTERHCVLLIFLTSFCDVACTPTATRTPSAVARREPASPPARTSKTFDRILKSAKGAFSVGLPTGWKVESAATEGREVANLESPSTGPEDPSRAVITVSRRHTEEELQGIEHVQYHIDIYREWGFQLIGRKKTTLDGMPAEEFWGSAAKGHIKLGGVVMMIRQVMLVGRRTCFWIAVACRVQWYKGYEKLFDQVIASVRVHLDR